MPILKPNPEKIGSQPLRDKIAIVTGASRGIGEATVLALARAGAHVALGARTAPDLERVAAEVHLAGRQALPVVTDVTKVEQVQHLVDQTLEQWQRVDILVANAGLYVRRPVAQVTVEDVEQAMAVNFYGALHAVRAVLPAMLSRRSGHVVLVTSMDGKKGLPQDAPYVAAKFALSGFADVARQELRQSGVHVTTVFPGRVDTGMVAHLKVPWISAKIPPEQVADSIVNALIHPQPEVVVPKLALALVYINTLSPRMGDWFVRTFRLEGWE
ncbi:MAG: SDR family NAD(P)-dependent oxidoreductase [Chloroflexi bacterium]|nr:SDR family NAD(P)-dependent oxidoreductase [Chloroflexota bacterium]